jgi:hypothetical protein
VHIQEEEEEEEASLTSLPPATLKREYNGTTFNGLNRPNPVWLVYMEISSFLFQGNHDNVNKSVV